MTATRVSTTSERLSLPEAPAAVQQALADGRAVAWSEPVPIRTYAAGEPSRYPMFLDQRVYGTVEPRLRAHRGAVGVPRFAAVRDAVRGP